MTYFYLDHMQIKHKNSGVKNRFKINTGPKQLFKNVKQKTF